jgi:NTE family protein
MLMAKNVHGEAQPYLPTRKWVDGSIADDLPAKRLSRLYSTNHYIVSMVNPIAIPFLHKEGERSALSAALGSLGIGMGRELLNFYRGMVQKQGDNWPRFNMLMSSIHALMDQEYSGDVNIVPSFRWYNPTKLLSHLSEKDLMELMEGGEHSTYPSVEAIRICTKVSRTMEEILRRFETGDLRPDASEYHRPRSSRRRPPPTRADRKAIRERKLQEGKSQKVDKSKPAQKPAVSKAAAKKTAAKKSAARKTAPAKKAVATKPAKTATA